MRLCSHVKVIVCNCQVHHLEFRCDKEENGILNRVEFRESSGKKEGCIYFFRYK